MKKIHIVIIVFLFFFAVSIIAVNGTLPRFDLLGMPNYLIVTSDDFYKSSQLAELKTLKINEGYNTEIVNLTTIYKTFPLSNTAQLLKIKTIEGIKPSESTGLAFLWWDGTKYRMWANTYYYPFTIIDAPSVAKEPILWVRRYYGDYNAFSIELTYDGGQKININVPSGYINFGFPFITTTGNVYYNRTYADSIHDYIMSYSAGEYVLLVGNIDKIPSYYTSWVENQETTIETDMTDHFYSMRNLYQNKYLLPDVAVGRLPIQIVSDLNIVLQKIKAFKPNMSKKATMMKGPDTGGEESFNSLSNYVMQTLNVQYGNVLMTKLINASYNTVISTINRENDNVVFFCHGGTNVIAVPLSGYISSTTVANEIAFNNCTTIISLSCYTADFSKLHSTVSVGESFIMDSNSKVIAYMGSTTQTYGSFDLCRVYYDTIDTAKTIGKCFNQAKSGNVYLEERLAWVLLGDPSLKLYVENMPPTISYGWLDLSFTINSTIPIVTADFSVTFPNGTVKTYSFIRQTINYCPVGSYFVRCSYNNQSQFTTISIEKDKGSSVNFNFIVNTNPPQITTGNIYVTANVNAEVEVSYGNSVLITRATPFALINYTAGTYVLKASYGEYTLTHTITLVAGQTLSDNFEFYIPNPQTTYLDLVWKYLPYGFIGIGVILIAKWK